ncbi:MAG: glycine cleavage system protein GcvH [Gammaproteobacteria bacterium SHHR-1]|uniref:glycine cleavage system protein GcvH n=1 Tax=Magnetovirga frankeli TaxID=947516 RepID=UPI001293D3AD|nr:glycine cleavage system protein GcvH [gamma proteobacterium SS-5]
MNPLPNDLKYASSHEWIRNEGDGTASIGITDHAQGQLGDLVYIELPEPGSRLEAGRECAVVESVKAASDIYSPVSGEVIAINPVLADSPETVNESPFNDGWLLRIRMDDPTQLEDLLDAEAYLEQLDA